MREINSRNWITTKGLLFLASAWSAFVHAADSPIPNLDNRRPPVSGDLELLPFLLLLLLRNRTLCGLDVPIFGLGFSDSPPSEQTEAAGLTCSSQRPLPLRVLINVLFRSVF